MRGNDPDEKDREPDDKARESPFTEAFKLVPLQPKDEAEEPTEPERDNDGQEEGEAE